ncbi:MAG: ABC transporter ATP-binding protein [Spirochaetia bacterium]|jgi:branched-chain amino acid transport system ATP-binding protein|nr:ABC transporter ATP-binding protein [Spirochaetia bacterium]
MEKIMEIDNLSMVFGGLKAIDNINISIKPGAITALIGPNGAGKTTLFNCITGVYKPTAGSVYIRKPGQKESEKISGLRPHVINRKGLARTFQNIRLFSNMSVLENVMVGRHHKLRASIMGALLRDRKTREEEEKVVNDSYEILKKINLHKFVNEMARNLPYGAQRRLEIARALSTDPFLLLLDEPAAGMNPLETRELEETINRLRSEENISILLIEHDMSLVMNISEHIYVVDYGKMIAEGTPDEVKRNPDVIKAYLGE